METDDDRRGPFATAKSWGAVFGVALAAVLAFTVIDAVLVGDVAEGTSAWPDRTNVSGSRAVFVETVPTDPGDMIDVQPSRWVGDPLEPTAFYAVPPPEVDAIVNGSEPDRSYRSIPIETDPYSGSHPRIHVEAPEDGDAVALAYVYENASDVPVPEGEQARGYYHAWAQHSVEFGALGTWENADRVEAWADPVHRVLLALTGVTGVLALLAGALWMRRLLADPDGDAVPSERALSLVEAARDYLDHQRSVLWMLGIAIPLGFVVSIEAVRGSIDGAGPGPGWANHVVPIVVAVWVLVALAWLILLRRVHRDRQTWERATDDPPLEL